MTQKKIHNRPSLTDHRKDLRNNGTSAEAVLWTRLKSTQLDGRKFRRQHSIGPYILDFYCTEERLGIELDGAHHYTTVGYELDEERTAYLNEVKIRILRFENKLVFEDIEAVLAEIKKSFS